MTDEQITQAAREICAMQAWHFSSDASERYLSGEYDRTKWMQRIVSALQGIRHEFGVVYTEAGEE